GFYFEGHGFGHGVGLCVLGSVRRAARGDSAPAILKAYFPGLKIAAAPPLRLAPVTAPPDAPIAAGERVQPDQPVKPGQPNQPVQPEQRGKPGEPEKSRARFELALPPSAEPNRTAIEAMVARELETLSTATKQAVPVELRI